jgi:hypothetical protein
MNLEPAVLAIRAALALVLVIAVWWAGDSIVDMIRAPVVVERDEARAEAKGERQAKEWLNKVIVDRAGREDTINRKVEGISRDLNELKKQSPAARDWADTRIPDDVIGVSRYAATAPVLRDPGGGTGPGAGAERLAAGRDESRPPESEKPVLGSAGQSEPAPERAGHLRETWSRLTQKMKGKP